MAFVHGRAKLRETIGGWREFQIRTGNRITQVEQHLGNATHADASNTREMEMLPRKKHVQTLLFREGEAMSMRICAARYAAPGCASFRALALMACRRDRSL